MRHSVSNASRMSSLITQIQDHMRLYDYELIDLPLIGPADLFLIKAGDQLIERLVTFERHGRELALRPEFTALAANRVIQSKMPAKVTRWQFQGPVFQDVFNSRGESVQRFSVGAELIGMYGAVADAEIVGMALRGLRAIGLSNIQITIGHAGLTRNALKRYQLDSQTEKLLLQHQETLSTKPEEKQLVLEMLTHYLKSSGEHWRTGENSLQPIITPREPGQPLTPSSSRSPEDIARRMIRKRHRGTEISQVASAIEFLAEWSKISDEPGHAFDRLADFIPHESGKQILDDWRTTIGLLEAYDISKTNITIQPSLVRSWEYYSGIVFELKHINLHLGGGGRYDGLAQLLGSEEDIPAVGFAYYMDSVLSVLPDQHSVQHILAAIPISFSPQDASIAVSLATQMRDHGIPCVLIDKRENSISGNVVSLGPDSTVNFLNKIYSLDQIELLIARLRQVS